jgi:type III secretory pathway component EscS
VKSNGMFLSLLKALSTLQQWYVSFTVQAIVYLITMALWTSVKSNDLFLRLLKVSSS